VSHVCAGSQDCCPELVCEGTDSNNNIFSCGTGGATGCSCQVQCVGSAGGSCNTAGAPCCTVGYTCTSGTTGLTCTANRPG
jgi:hypothetical protein